MGFCYDIDGRLACDRCGKSGGVRRVPCPFDQCGPDALCQACRKETRTESRAYHATNCKPFWTKRQDAAKLRTRLLTEGRWLVYWRRGSVSPEGGTGDFSEVGFESGSGGELVVRMPASRVDAFPDATTGPVTLEDLGYTEETAEVLSRREGAKDAPLELR